MKTYFLFSILAVSLLLPGCIIYSSVRYEIEYNENFNMGTVTVTYRNIMDSEQDLDKQKKDFTDLIDMLEGDEFLVDIIDDGIYVTDRRLYKENGILIGTYSGLFKNLKIDSEEIKTNENERVLIIEKGEGDVVTSNGKILKTEDSYIISWPKDSRHLEFTVKPNLGEPTYSLIEYYHEWKNK